MVRRELVPLILSPNSKCRAIMLSVTTAMDMPKERAILSRILKRLKKTNVQAKPGTKNTSINPRIALMVGRRSAQGITELSSSMLLYYSIREVTSSTVREWCLP
jgi:hypothetical protein